MADKKVYKEKLTLNILSSSLTSFDISELKELCINELDDCSNIKIDLKNVNQFDIAGLQFIKSLEKTDLEKLVDHALKTILY